MAMVIAEECIACDACAANCPNKAIAEGDPIYVIDPQLCTECVGFYDNPQCVAICPVDCIIPNPDHEETHEELMNKFRRLHPD